MGRKGEEGGGKAGLIYSGSNAKGAFGAKKRGWTLIKFELKKITRLEGRDRGDNAFLGVRGASLGGGLPNSGTKVAGEV